MYIFDWHAAAPDGGRNAPTGSQTVAETANQGVEQTASTGLDYAAAGPAFAPSQPPAKKANKSRAGGVLLGFVILVSLAFGQTDNTFYVKRFLGTDVGSKVSATMQACNPNASIPCILVLDPSLAVYPQGTMPSLCPQCTLWDWRTGAPSGSGYPGVTSDGFQGLRITGKTQGASFISAGIPSFNVMDSAFAGGADPTGVADSGPAIRAAETACNAATAAGRAGVVYFPHGIYSVSSSISYTPPGSSAYNVGFLEGACQQVGDGSHSQTVIQWTGASGGVDALMGVASTDFAFNTTSGGISSMEVTANNLANRSIIFFNYVDQGFKFENVKVGPALLYDLDYIAGWVNAKARQVRFDGTGPGGYFIRLVGQQSAFLNSWSLTDFTIASSNNSNQPAGVILIDASQSALANVGDISFKNARIELNTNTNGIASNGSIVQVTASPGQTLASKGGVISFEDVTLQNQVFNASTHPNWFASFTQTDGSQASGFIFSFTNFYYSGLSGFDCPYATCGGSWIGASHVTGWPGGAGTASLNGTYGPAVTQNVRTPIYLQGLNETDPQVCASGLTESYEEYCIESNGTQTFDASGVITTLIAQGGGGTVTPDPCPASANCVAPTMQGGPDSIVGASVGTTTGTGAMATLWTVTVPPLAAGRCINYEAKWARVSGTANLSAQWKLSTTTITAVSSVSNSATNWATSVIHICNNVGVTNAQTVLADPPMISSTIINGSNGTGMSLNFTSSQTLLFQVDYAATDSYQGTWLRQWY